MYVFFSSKDLPFSVRIGCSLQQTYFSFLSPAYVNCLSCFLSFTITVENSLLLSHDKARVSCRALSKNHWKLEVFWLFMFCSFYHAFSFLCNFFSWSLCLLFIHNKKSWSSPYSSIVAKLKSSVIAFTFINIYPHLRAIIAVKRNPVLQEVTPTCLTPTQSGLTIFNNLKTKSAFPQKLMTDVLPIFCTL